MGWRSDSTLVNRRKGFITEAIGKNKLVVKNIVK
jgi:hypothetical protein